MINFYSKLPFLRKTTSIFFLTAFLIVLLVNNSHATTYYPSSAGGNWNAGAAWSTVSCGSATNCRCTPGLSSDVIQITCAKTITVTSSVIQTGAITISGGTLIINSGVTVNCTSLSMTSGTLTVNGTLNIGAGGAGAFSITGGTFTQQPTAEGTIGLTAGAQAFSCNQTLYNLNIAGFGDKTMGTDISVYNQLSLTTNNLIVGTHLSSGGNFVIGANTLTLNGPVIMSGTCFCNQITGGAAADLTIGNSPGGAVGLSFDLSNTSANGSNTIRNFTNNRTGNSVVMLSSMRIGGTLAQSSSSSTISIAPASFSHTLTIDGSISGDGGFIGNAVRATMIINGNGALSTSNLNFYTDDSLSNLTMNRFTNGTATLGTPLTVYALTLNQGLLILGANDLTVTNSITGNPGEAANMIVTSSASGKLVRLFPVAAYTVPLIYPIGEIAGTTTYNGFTFTMNTNDTSAKSIGFKVVDDTCEAHIGSAPDYLTRYYNSSVSGSGSYNYSMSLPYVGTLSSDCEGGGGDIVGMQSNIAAAYYNAGWHYAGAIDTVNHWLVFSGVTNSAMLLGYDITGLDSASIILAVNSVPAQEQEIKIYPNPVSNQLVVSGLNCLENSNLYIYNMLGEVICSQRSDTKPTTAIDVSALAPGIYFVKIKDKENTTVLKFVKVSEVNQ